ncbi:Protein CEPU-1 [Folsomia candida]|uniref:Protein CEPU-1 n=1 Tax=Folsomia candida TaxID=158441 RepID=A0A226F1A3_FOLCA|nr:Protein CEPU-1 [Folsomia candida]
MLRRPPAQTSQIFQLSSVPSNCHLTYILPTYSSISFAHQALLLVVYLNLIPSDLLELCQAAYEAGFIGPMKNVTVVQGKDASFTCMVDNMGGHRVDTKAILAIHDNVITNNPRLSVTMNDKVTWTLNIRNSQPDDAGLYMCQISNNFNQMANLVVVIPPDIISDETTGDVMVPEGGTAKLVCRAKGFPAPVVTWVKEDGGHIIVKDHHGGGKRKVKSFESEMLNLTKIVRSEMGAYLCIASNGVPPSVSKRILVAVHSWLENHNGVVNVFLARPPPQVVLYPLTKNAPEISLVSFIKSLPQQCAALSVVGSSRSFDQRTEELRSPLLLVLCETLDRKQTFLILTHFYATSPPSVFLSCCHSFACLAFFPHRLKRREHCQKSQTGYKCISQNSMGSTEGNIHIHEIPYSSLDKGGGGDRLPPPADSMYSSGEDDPGSRHHNDGRRRGESTAYTTPTPQLDPFQPIHTPNIVTSTTNEGSNFSPLSNLALFLLLPLLLSHF